MDFANVPNLCGDTGLWVAPNQSLNDNPLPPKPSGFICSFWREVAGDGCIKEVVV